MLPDNIKWDAVWQSIVDTWLPLVGGIALIIIIIIVVVFIRHRRH